MRAAGLHGVPGRIVHRPAAVGHTGEQDHVWIPLTEEDCAMEVQVKIRLVMNRNVQVCSFYLMCKYQTTIWMIGIDVFVLNMWNIKQVSNTTLVNESIICRCTYYFFK